MRREKLQPVADPPSIRNLTCNSSVPQSDTIPQIFASLVEARLTPWKMCLHEQQNPPKLRAPKVDDRMYCTALSPCSSQKKISTHNTTTASERESWSVDSPFNTPHKNSINYLQLGVVVPAEVRLDAALLVVLKVAPSPPPPPPPAPPPPRPAPTVRVPTVPISRPVSPALSSRFPLVYRRVGSGLGVSTGQGVHVGNRSSNCRCRCRSGWPVHHRGWWRRRRGEREAHCLLSRLLLLL